MSKKTKTNLTDDEMLDKVMGEIEEFLFKNFKGNPPVASFDTEISTDQRLNAFEKAITLYREPQKPPAADWDVWFQSGELKNEYRVTFRMKGR